MKKLKFLPALALMMVAVLTFAFTPAKKNLADRLYQKVGTEWVLIEEAPTGCEGAGDICYLIVPENNPEDDAETIGAAAEAELANHPNDVDFSFAYGQVRTKE